MKTIFRVSSYLFRHPLLFSLDILMAVGSTLFLIVVPIIIEFVIDDLVTTGDMGFLLRGMGYIVLCFAAQDILNSLRIRINNALEQRVLVELRKELHTKLLDLPVSFYDKRKSGEIASRVVEDVNNVERALLDGTEQGTVALLTLFGIVIILFSKQPLLATLMMVPLPILIFLGINHARATRKNWKLVRESSGQMNSQLVEDIQANRLIQSFNLKARETSRFLAVAQELRKRTLKAMFRWSIYNPTSNFTASLGMVAVVGLGGYKLGQGDISFGAFLAFFAYARMLYEPINRLNGLNHMLAAGKASGDRVFEILDHPVDVEEPEDPKPYPSGILEVKYDSVRFAYPQRDAVIPALNLTLSAGKVTALVGHTGAGKSTIAGLLLRYYDVTAGKVTINGTDVRDLSLIELRGNIGFVAQDPFLFDGTVEENLLLAKQNATREEIIAALKGARAWDFVSHLPEGLHTLIGERGIRLSMGEKQRLTIARVILKNPPIVILDEATSSVDTITEKYIQEALEALMHDRTVLIIAHRLSTVRKADTIVVLDHGKIIEEGNHEALIKKHGQYAALWQIQHDFIPEMSK